EVKFNTDMGEVEIFEIKSVVDSFSDPTHQFSVRDAIFFSSRRRHTRSVSAFLLNRSSDLVLDLTEDDFDFLTSNKVWIATDRSRARRCVEACVYGTLDFVGYPRFPAPVEFIAAVIAYYVHPVNIQTACLIMEGAEFT